jgi:hypothetical protein
MLDYQLKVKDKFKMQGNMSSNEKAINRYDLEAYKNYDSRHFSLVPGIHHSKYNSMSLGPSEDPEFVKMDFNQKLNYLKGIGYNPGVGAH